MVVMPKLAPIEATRRWAALLRQIYEVDPLVCPRCAGAMRLVSCITQSAVIDLILAHLRTRAAAGPTGRPASRADGRPPPPGAHPGGWHGVKRRAILLGARLEFLSRPARLLIISNVKKSGDENAEEILGPGFRSDNPAALPRLAAVITAITGLVGLAGWAFTIPLLKSVLPGAVEMKVNTALGLMLAACALFILCDRPSSPLQRLAQALALLVAALGLATLGQYVFGWQLGIDELLFRDTTNLYNPYHGRMAPLTSVALTLIGLALAAVPRPRLQPLARVAAILVMSIGAVVFLGYLWNASELIADRWLPPVAINTAFAFVLLGAGTFIAIRTPEQQRAAGRSMARSAIETRILAGFIGALVLLFVVSGYSYRTSVEFAESARQVALTEEARTELNRLDASISTAESEQRRYLLTGDPRSKETYTRHAAQVSTYEQSLSRLVADSPEEMRLLATLRPFIDQRMNALARNVSVFERQGRSAALAAMASDDGIPAMEAIDILVDRMDDLETALLSKREAGSVSTRGRLLVALLVMLAVATAMLTLLYSGIRREIVGRAQTEDALRASEEYRRAILDTVVDGVITIDERGKVETANPAAERIFGYTTAELIGRNVKMLMPDPHQSQHDAYVEHHRATDESTIIGFGREGRGRTKDGSTFPMELAVGEMRLRGERHYTGIVRDITTRKEAEQAVLAARDEAQQANAAKDTFLATMSHEIRTPLNGLLGMLELLALTRLDSEQHGTLEIARDSGRGLVRIIDDVLDHAKIEAGMLEIRLEPVSIAQVLRRVLSTYHAVASVSDLTLTQIVDPRISPSLLADPLRVSQILNNLVSNALKFTTEGYVEVRAELLGRSGGADTVCLSVKDTGIGIAVEAQQRLFQSFQQADAVTAQLYGGTGLGLAISRRLAEMMGGTIQVKSAPGEGTTMNVTLTLPISEAAPVELGGSEATPAVTPILATAAPGARPLVLAVDDHPTNRELLARQIAALGLRARMAADGLEALALWRAGGIALVVTDCNMPHLDGYALSRAIRETEAKEGRLRTPVIAWTANVRPDVAARCHAAGMDDILTKPAEMAMLKQVLAKWLPSAATAMVGPDDADAASGRTQAPSVVLAGLDKIAATAAERAEILLDFMTQIRSDLDGLRVALTVEDLPACARIAHRMKGSSRMVGAQDLAAACEAMEHAVRQDSPRDADSAKATMDRALERLEAHVAETTATREEQE
jgi:PAS domain S-box-containing protein